MTVSSETGGKPLASPGIDRSPAVSTGGMSRTNTYLFRGRRAPSAIWRFTIRHLGRRTVIDTTGKAARSAKVRVHVVLDYSATDRAQTGAGPNGAAPVDQIIEGGGSAQKYRAGCEVIKPKRAHRGLRVCQGDGADTPLPLPCSSQARHLDIILVYLLTENERCLGNRKKTHQA